MHSYGQNIDSGHQSVRRAWRQLPILIGALVWLHAVAAQAQSLSGINSGVSPEPGLTYNNRFLFYSRSEEKGPMAIYSPPDNDRSCST